MTIYCCFVNWLKHETLARVAAQTRTYTLNLSKALLMVINVKDLLQIKDLTLDKAIQVYLAQETILGCS